jgi:alpha-glucosidase (family GH31 glycosyl hydrolase)
VEDQVRDVAMLRMRLMPYIYSTFARYHFEGIPPFRAMQLVEGLNPQSDIQDIKYQYMMGESILVAPMFAGEDSREVYLPPGKWYDFYTGKLAGEEEVITVSPGLDHIPLYVKNGAIVPMLKEERTRMPVEGEKLALEIRHYGMEPGTFILYDDDGVSFNYEKGMYSMTELMVSKGGTTLTPGMKVSNEAFFNYTSDPDWVFMTE